MSKNKVPDVLLKRITNNELVHEIHQFYINLKLCLFNSKTDKQDEILKHDKFYNAIETIIINNLYTILDEGYDIKDQVTGYLTILFKNINKKYNYNLSINSEINNVIDIFLSKSEVIILNTLIDIVAEIKI